MRYAALCVGLLLATVAVAGDPIRVAVVSRGGSPVQVQQIEDMLVARLSDVAGVALVERTAVRRVLEEQGLAQTGAVEPESISRLGSLLGADVFAVLEVDAATGDAIGLTGFDARTGVRLHDQTLRLEPEGELAAVAPALRQIAAKRRAGPQSWRVLAMLPPRNVDLPASMDGEVQAISRLLERALPALPFVVLVERERLEHVLAERALPTTQPEGEARDLITSALTVQVEVSRAEGDHLRVDALVFSADGKLLDTIIQQSTVGSSAECVRALTGEIAIKVLKSEISPAAVDREAEAYRFAVEAASLARQGRWALAVPCSQAAVALRPGTPAYLYGLMFHEVMLAKWLLFPHRAEWHGGGTDAIRADDATVARAEVLTLDAFDQADAVTASQPPPASRPTLNTPSLLNPSGADGHIPDLISNWRRLQPANERQRDAAERVRLRYKRFQQLNIERLFDVHNRGQLERAFVIWPHTSAALLYAGDRDELARELNTLLGRWLDVLDLAVDDPRFRSGRRNPPMALFLASSFEQLTMQFVLDNGVTSAYQRRDFFRADSRDTAEWIYPSLERMSEHRQPLVRSFGRALRLWADQKLRRIDEAEALRRTDALVDEIAAGVPAADERTRSLMLRLINDAFRHYGGRGRPGFVTAVAEAASEHPGLTPLIERVARELLPLAGAQPTAEWLHALIAAGDEPTRRWAFEQIDAAQARLVKDNAVLLLADLRRSALAKHPELGAANRASVPWTRSQRVFDARDWPSPDSWGEIWGADPRGDAVLVLVRHRAADKDDQYVLDLVRVPLDLGVPKRLNTAAVFSKHQGAWSIPACAAAAFRRASPPRRHPSTAITSRCSRPMARPHSASTDPPVCPAVAWRTLALWTTGCWWPRKTPAT